MRGEAVRREAVRRIRWGWAARFFVSVGLPRPE